MWSFADKYPDLISDAPEWNIEMAKDPSTPPDILATLAFYPNLEIRNAALAHSNIPIETLVRASTDPDVSWVVASNPKTPIETLFLMADGDPAIFGHGLSDAVVRNPSTTTKLLKHILAKYPNDWFIARDVILHPNVDEEILIGLATYIDGGPRLNLKDYILCNTKTPEPVKMWLRNDGYAGMTLREFLDNVY